MFISKKRFKEEIEKAKFETEEKIYQQQRMKEFQQETYREIERIRCDFGKHNSEVDERLSRLEKAILQPIEINLGSEVGSFGKFES